MVELGDFVGYLDHPRYRKWLATMVIVSPQDLGQRGTPSRPFHDSWLINGGDPILLTKWDDPPSMNGLLTLIPGIIGI